MFYITDFDTINDQLIRYGYDISNLEYKASRLLLIKPMFKILKSVSVSTIISNWQYQV